MTEPFIPLAVPRPPLTPHRLFSEPRAWTSVSQVARHHLDPPVSHVSFSPVAPYDLAATSGFSVSLIGSRAGTVRRTLERFRETPYSASYKKDGRLLVAGSGMVAKVFDLGSRAVLRTFRGHKGDVKSVMFSTDGRRVMTAADDSIVKAWDLATQKCLFSLTDATDNVRSQNSSPVSQHVWITGSHDRKARLYDVRAPRCLFTIEHGAQIDDVHILPGGARAITVGGMHVRVWDFFMGGKIVHNLSCHAKAATSVAVCPEAEVFATAGLDGCVKVHDLSTFRSKGRMHFESEILSVDMSTDGVKYAVGMANGVVDIRTIKQSSKHVTSIPQSTDRKVKEFEGYGRGFQKVWKEPSKPIPGGERYFNRGRKEKPEDETEVVVKKYRQIKLEDYDQSLRRFSHGEALDLAVKKGNPATVVAVVEELLLRGALRGALAGREQEELVPLLGVIRRNLRKPRYTARLTHVMNVILDLYGEEFGRNENVDREVRAIWCGVKREVVACYELSTLQGKSEAILCASGQVV